MKRIIIHWTAGTYFPTNYEKEHYHFLVDAKGEIHYGVFKPEANEICKAGKYAAHTGGGNTGCMRLKGNPKHARFSYWLSMYKDAFANLKSKVSKTVEEHPTIKISRR